MQIFIPMTGNGARFKAAGYKRLKPFIKYANKNRNLKNSEKWSKECLSLPIYPGLKSSEINLVVKEIKNFFKIL